LLLRGGCVTSFTINARDSSSFVPFTEEELWKECANAHRFSPEEGGGEAEEGGEKKKRKDEKDDGGVMNAEAGEGAGTPKETLMNGWSELQKRVRRSLESHRMQLLRVDTGPTRAAYEHQAEGEGDDGTQPKMAAWRLDHILYTDNHNRTNDSSDAHTRTLIPVSVWRTLEADRFSVEKGA
jgi:hypothetical protein